MGYLEQFEQRIKVRVRKESIYCFDPLLFWKWSEIPSLGSIAMKSTVRDSLLLSPNTLNKVFTQPQACTETTKRKFYEWAQQKTSLTQQVILSSEMLKLSGSIGNNTLNWLSAALSFNEGQGDIQSNSYLLQVINHIAKHENQNINHAIEKIPEPNDRWAYIYSPPVVSTLWGDSLTNINPYESIHDLPTKRLIAHCLTFLYALAALDAEYHKEVHTHQLHGFIAPLSQYLNPYSHKGLKQQIHSAFWERIREGFYPNFTDTSKKRHTMPIRSVHDQTQTIQP